MYYLFSSFPKLKIKFRKRKKYLRINERFVNFVENSNYHNRKRYCEVISSRDTYIFENSFERRLKLVDKQ